MPSPDEELQGSPPTEVNLSDSVIDTMVEEAFDDDTSMGKIEGLKLGLLKVRGKAGDLKEGIGSNLQEKQQQVRMLVEILKRGNNATPAEIYLYRSFIHDLSRQILPPAERMRAIMDSNQFKNYLGRILTPGVPTQEHLNEIRIREMTSPTHILPDIYNSIPNNPDEDEVPLTAALASVTAQRIISSISKDAAAKGIKIALMHGPHTLLMRGAISIGERLMKNRPQKVDKYDEIQLNKEFLGYLLFNNPLDERVSDISAEIIEKVSTIKELKDVLSAGIGKIRHKKK